MTIATVERTDNLVAQMNYAETLAASNLLPAAYRNNPPNVLLAMQMGAALGIPPIQAINSIFVIDGKPTASADLIAALVRRAGHKLRIALGHDQDGPTVTATLIRHDDPDFAFEATWTMAKARQAKLTGKGVWQTYPDQMLRNRAITEVCRQGAGDALYGVIYTPEELGADDSAPAPSADPERPMTAQQIIEQHEPDPDPHNAATGEPLASRGQVTALWIKAKAQGMDADYFREWIDDNNGRHVDSTKELTRTEVSRLLNLLDQPIIPEPVDAEVVDDAQ